MKLSGVMLNSENPKVLGEFYTEMLGKPGWQDGQWYGFYVNGGSLMVGPHSEVRGMNEMPGRLMVNFEAEDVKAEFARIEALGAKVIAKPYQPSKEDNPEMWLTTFADPDGNYFQISTPWQE